MKKINIKALIVSILIPLAVGGITGLITMPFMDYGELINPPLSPPGWVFPVVWNILYILMGISFYLIYESNDLDKESSYIIYFLQLIVNGLWSIFFFVFKWRLFSSIWLFLLIVLVIVMIIKFYKINKVSGLLQLPYLLWCIFAFYLNIGFYILN